MSIISGKALVDLIDNIAYSPVENIGYTSVDVKLDNWFAIEADNYYDQWEEIYTNRLILIPNKFVKARLDTVFKIPKNVVGMFTVRSKYAQLGLEQSTSVFMHPGFDRKLILELKNFSERRQIPLVSGESVGQITFFRCSEELVKLE